jgi:hypothetical protein
LFAVLAHEQMGAATCSGRDHAFSFGWKDPASTVAKLDNVRKPGRLKVPVRRTMQAGSAYPCSPVPEVACAKEELVSAFAVVDSTFRTDDHATMRRR